MRIFEFVPFYTFQTVKGYRVLTTEMESGKEYRYYKGKIPREWDLSFVGTAEDIKQIEDFFDSMKGPLTAFRWTPPNETSSIIVRFKEQTLEGEGTGLQFKSINFTLKEVF